MENAEVVWYETNLDGSLAYHHTINGKDQNDVHSMSDVNAVAEKIDKDHQNFIKQQQSEIQKQLSSNPIEAAKVADNIKSDMDNGITTGPNGETSIDQMKPSDVANTIEQELSINKSANSNKAVDQATTTKSTEDKQATTPVKQTEDNKGQSKLSQSRLNSSLHNIGSKATGSLYNAGNLSVNIVDVDTGKKVPIYSIMDATRLSRNGQYYGSVIGQQNIPNSLLGAFVKDNKESYSPWSCVNALGMYNTEYIRKRVTEFTSVNSDLGAFEDDYVREDMVFRGYSKGGASPISQLDGKPKVITEENEENTKRYKRISDRLGIGLGECCVLNPPFQFNKRDDPRTNPIYPKIGRVYSTQIMNNWPIVLFQPGRLKYNTGFFKMLGLGMGAGVTESLIRTGGDGIRGAFAKMASVVSDTIGVIGTIGSAILSGGTVVEFKQSIKLYKQYLSFLLEDLAGIMGLTNGAHYFKKKKKLTLEDILPIKFLNGGIAKYYNTQFIPFRCSKDVTGAESFSNSTTTNPIMEKLNSEAEEADNSANEADPSTGIKDKLKNVAKKAGMKLLGSFSEEALVLSGRGRITLPDVFSSSSFSRSITLSFKFHAPYGDTLCQFENEFVQLMVLLAMGVPRQTGKLSYTSPFAVRVFIKNRIMINCGMIESISVTRGGDTNDWCPNGFPKTLSVDVTVKDMEPNISLPMASRGPLRMALEVMFPSTGMSEYLSSIGGLPMDQMTHNFRKEHLRRATTAFVNAWSKRFDMDTLQSAIVNSRLGSAITGLVAGSDMDILTSFGNGNLNNTMTNTKDMSRNVFTMPGLGFHNLAVNGDKGGYSTVANEDKQTLESISNLADTISNDNSFYSK